MTTFTTTAFPTSTSNPMIAPFWANVDTRLGNGAVYYRVVSGADSTYDPYFSSNFGLNFVTAYKVVSTWDSVGYYNQQGLLRNTFQNVLYVSADGYTVSCMNYPTLGINWVCGSGDGCSAGFPVLTGTPAQVGYNAGDGLRAYTLPGSRTVAVQTLPTLNNLGVVGQFCNRVDQSTITACTPTASCLSGTINVPAGRAPLFSDLNNNSSLCGNIPLLSKLTAWDCSQLLTSFPVTLTVGTSTCTANLVPVASMYYSTCPSSPITVTTNNCQTTATWDVQLYSDCVPIEVSSAIPGVTLFSIGTTTVTYTATSLSIATVATCTFDVNVIYTGPAPSLTSISDIITPIATPGVCSIAVTWIPPLVLNSCSSYSLTSNYNPPYSFDINTSTTVQYTYSDSLGYLATTSFNVTIQDLALPIITCPLSVIGYSDHGQCSTHLTIPPPIITDCLPTTYTTNITSGASVAVGSLIGTYVGLDSAGNEEQCSYTVLVIDNEAPTITCKDAYIPAYNSSCDSSDALLCLSVAIFPLPDYSDNCANPILSLVAGVEVGSLLSVGLYVNLYLVIDASGNTAQCSMNVELVGIQITSPLSTSTVNIGDTVNFQFVYYLPNDTQAIYRIINTVTGRTIAADYVDLSQNHFTYTFCNTASPGTFTASLTAATSGVKSMADPTFKVV